MLNKPGVRTSDTVSWLLVAIIAAGCVLSVRGMGFVVDGARSVLPGLGLLALVGAVLFGKARRRPRLVAGATAFLQMTLFTMMGVVLAYALAARGGPLWDARLAAADARLGLDWAALFRKADAVPWALRLGGLAYHSLVAQMIVCIVVLSATGRTDALRTAVAAAILGGGATIAISGAIPAMGNLYDPAAFHHLPSSIAWQERGLIAGLRDGSGRILDLSRLMGIVSFPSYHTTLPVILAWSLRDVRLLRIAAPFWAVLTIIATPVFGGHYGVDVLAGLVLAAAAIALTPLLVIRADRPTSQPVIRRRDGRARRTVPACRLVDEGAG